MANEKKDVVQLLKDALGRADIDHDVVLSLASSLAKNDQDNVRFTIDAGLINRLGLELVSKQETAVAELIKNAYDADATSVELIFKDVSKPGGILEISDTGLGMNREQLIDGFMRLSTQQKTAHPTSTKYKRRRAGRKGIGRFSAQRLGTKLTIRTRQEDAPRGLEVVIDWDKFLPGKELITIANQIREIEGIRSGTTLVIDNLRDAWDEENIARSYRYVSSLQQPFPLSKTKRGDDRDPGFKVTFHLDVGNDLKVIADQETTILEHALAKVSGYVDSDGQGYWSMECQRFGIRFANRHIGPKRDEPRSKFKSLRKVRFSAAYFITRADLLPKLFYKEIQETLNKSGGIRVYRNGFRVLPYGEPYDDWLRLDRSSALREILPPHRNNNFLGFVEINDTEGTIFQETASREGLVENEAYRELQEFVSKCLKNAAIVVAEKRDKKVRTQDKKPKSRKEVSEVIRELRRLIGRNMPALETLGALQNQIVELDETREQLVDELAMLRVLGSLGLSIGEFTHEIRHNLSALVADVASIKSKLPKRSTLRQTISRLESNLTMLKAYARYFDEAITDNAHRELAPHEVRDLLNSFERIVSPTVKRAAIKLEIEVNGYDLYTKPMHRSEWASVLLNLFTNAVKAIKRAGSVGEIFVRAGEDGKYIFVEFADNGDGIPEENKTRIFDAFFTTSSPPSPLAPGNEELVGAGLGLKITRDIVESHEGEIFLVRPPKGFSTSFRVEIPKASKAEIARVEN